MANPFEIAKLCDAIIDVTESPEFRELEPDAVHFALTVCAHTYIEGFNKEIDKRMVAKNGGRLPPGKNVGLVDPT